MTLRNDIFGCPVSMATTGDMDAWNQTQLGFLAHAAATPEHLGRAIASDPDFALPHICKGLFSLLLGKRELYDVALDAQKEARKAIARRPVTQRENTFLEALNKYNQGRPSHAAALLDGLVRHNPHDALAMKLVQAILFVLGDAQGMRSSIEHVIPHLTPDHAAYGYALGCHAFTLEETGEYRLAERIGREGVAHTPNDAWGLHAVAHVHDMTNDVDAGLEWLLNRDAAWAHCNNFRYHVWWHLALMHLDRREIDAVFALYDGKIRHDKTDDYRDISNAASLLSRLELEGIDVGDRWEELAALSDNRTQDGCLAFADLHYMLSLVGGGRKDAASRLIARMRKDAKAEAVEMDAIMKHPGLSAAVGLEAFGEGNFTTAFRHLAGARDVMQTIGGSHAQRDVFDRLTIEAALRGGYHDAARRFIDSRTAQRGGAVDHFAASRLAELNRQQEISVEMLHETRMAPAE
ncbi:MAG: tetratricopeptide repeat protein [Pseudomonadota bacterium]